MNAHSRNFALRVHEDQVAECSEIILHTVLMNRVHGRLSFKDDGCGGSRFAEDSVAFAEVDCESLDFSFVRVKSAKLVELVGLEVGKFVEELLRSGPASEPRRGQLRLEFVQKRTVASTAVGLMKLFQTVNNVPLPWEKWNVNVEVVERLANVGEEAKFREKLLDSLREHVIAISQTTSEDLYLPKMPTKADLGMVFDTSFEDINPYLFKISHSVKTCEDLTFRITSNIRRMLF